MPAQAALETQLRDIKPPLPIEDWSAYIYWGVIVLSVLVLGVALFWMVKLLLGLRRSRRRREYLSRLKQIDWNDPKQSAYDATHWGRLILGEDERLHELYAQMVTELEAYKYRKKVRALEPKARAQFDLFLGACDESL